MKTMNIEDRMEKAVTGLRGICAEMMMFELLIDESDQETHSTPNMTTLAEALGSIRMHLEQVEDDISSIVNKQV